MRLGTVFSSVVTGNLVLLGLAADRRSGSLAVSAGLAIAGYAAGALLGAALAGVRQPDQPVWPRRVTVALGAELVVTATFATGWLITGGRPAASGRLSLLALAAVAMGIQSAAVRRLGPISSTYLTGTLTSLLAGLLPGRTGRLPPAGWRRDAATLLGLLAGAFLGALAVTSAPAWLPVVILTPTAAVIATALVLGPGWCRAGHAPARLRRGYGAPDGLVPTAAAARTRAGTRLAGCR